MRKGTENFRDRVKVTGLSKADEELLEILSDSLTVNVTAEEFQAFDDSSFQATDQDDGVPAIAPFAVPDHPRGHRVSATSAEPVSRVIEQQTSLFPGWTRLLDVHIPRDHFTTLLPLVVQAYSDIREGWSADYVVLNPQKNLDFVQRCWRLGAVAAPEKLNWTLMNARKGGSLRGLASDQIFSLPRREMDEFSFAAEMAMRELQDRAWHEEQQDRLTLDKLLCSPRLSVEFDALARQIAPGFTPLQYRWAAMTLRKARRLVCSTRPMPLFEEAGLLTDIKPSGLSKDAGIYWVNFDDRSAFVGVAHSLRGQVDSFVGRLGAAAVPPWIEDRPIGKAHVRLLSMPKTSSNDRERMRSSIFQQAGSRLNFKDRSLFGQVA